MNSSVDNLIYRAEDTSVEFKSQQYVIARLKDGEGISRVEAKHSFEAKKSELLKDVLAMANAWRDGPGYILIGARENKGGPAEIIGLPDSDLYDDAIIQQFIGSKLAHALEFTYSVCDCQGQRIGLITIPKQSGRPFFAKESYGIVQARTVYVRRGSSTAIADPTEIARMGREEVSTSKSAEVVILVHDDAGLSLPDTRREVIVCDFGDIQAIDDYCEELRRDSLFFQLSTPNRHFHRDMAKAIHVRSRAIPVLVSVTNKSTYGLRDCKLELLVEDKSGASVELLAASDFPEYPQRNNLLTTGPGLRHLIAPRHAAESMSVADEGRCVFRFDLVRPGETVPSPERFAILASESTVICMKFRLLSGDLPQPVTFECEFGIEVARDVWNIEKLEQSLSHKEKVEVIKPA